MRLSKGVATGIVQIGLLAGLVPEIEEREAAIYNGYTWKQWLEFNLLDPEGRWHRASGVASYRMHHMIENNSQDAMSMEMDRRTKMPASREPIGD